VHEGHARGANRMSLYAGSGSDCDGLQAHIRRGAIEVGAVRISNDEGAAVEFLSAAFERLFGGLHVSVFEFVTERCESRLGSVVDREYRAIAFHATGCVNFPDAFHRHIEHLQIGDPSNLYAKKFAECPARVVVRSFLWIIRAPVLMIEQGIGDARVRLVHADNVAAGGKVS